MTDYYRAQEIACPHCGAVESDQWEWLGRIQDAGSEGDTQQCSACERDYLVSIEEHNPLFRVSTVPDGYRDRRQRAAAYRAMHERDLADHYLELVEDGEKVQCWLLRRGEDLMLSVAIRFTPWGIALQGDLTPSTIGDVSRSGYGVGWFSGQLSGGYLCEKFGLDAESAAGCWLIAIQQAFAREYAKRAVPAGGAGQ